MIDKRPTSLLTPPLTPCMSRLHIDSPDYDWESATAAQPPTSSDTSAIGQRIYCTATNDTISAYTPHPYRFDPQSRPATAPEQEGASTNTFQHWTGPNRHITDARQGLNIPGLPRVIEPKDEITDIPSAVQSFATAARRAPAALPSDKQSIASVDVGSYDLDDNINDDDDIDDYDEQDDQSADERGGDEEGEEPEPSKRKRTTKISDSLIQKRRMKRFRLNRTQTRFLVEEFAKYQHPDAALRQKLAQQIPGLTPRQVQVWFQNRRAKLKRTMDNHQQALRSRASLANAAPAAASASQPTAGPQQSGAARATASIAPNIPSSASVSRPQLAPAGGVLARIAQRYQPLATATPSGAATAAARATTTTTTTTADDRFASSLANTAAATSGFPIPPFSEQQQQSTAHVFPAIAGPAEYAAYYGPTSIPWFDHHEHFQHHESGSIADDHQQQQQQQSPFLPTEIAQQYGNPYAEQERRHTLPVGGAEGGAPPAPFIFPGSARSASFPHELGSIYDSPSVPQSGNREDSLSRTYSHEAAFGAMPPPPGTLSHVYDEEFGGGPSARDLFEYDDATGTMRPRMTYSDFLNSLQQPELQQLQQQQQQQYQQQQQQQQQQSNLQGDSPSSVGRDYHR